MTLKKAQEVVAKVKGKSWKYIKDFGLLDIEEAIGIIINLQKDAGAVAIANAKWASLKILVEEEQRG